jgi:hypothetical protein
MEDISELANGLATSFICPPDSFKAFFEPIRIIFSCLVYNYQSIFYDATDTENCNAEPIIAIRDDLTARISEESSEIYDVSEKRSVGEVVHNNILGTTFDALNLKDEPISYESEYTAKSFEAKICQVEFIDLFPICPIKLEFDISNVKFQVRKLMYVNYYKTKWLPILAGIPEEESRVELPKAHISLDNFFADVTEPFQANF